MDDRGKAAEHGNHGKPDAGSVMPGMVGDDGLGKMPDKHGQGDDQHDALAHQQNFGNRQSQAYRLDQGDHDGEEQCGAQDPGSTADIARQGDEAFGQGMDIEDSSGRLVHEPKRRLFRIAVKFCGAFSGPVSDFCRAGFNAGFFLQLTRYYYCLLSSANRVLLPS
jgi:hypothetical protein